MENKELYSKKFDNRFKINIIKISEDEVIIETDSEMIKLESYHSQDCCESVNADMATIKLYKEQLVDKYFNEIVVKGVKDMGFLLCFMGNTYENPNVKIFVPCYNSQNGYYSDNLELRINIGNTTTNVDLEGHIENDIC